MKTALGALTAMAVLLSSCAAEPPAAEPETKAGRRPPQPACDQASAELARRERDGAFLFAENGEAMTDRRSWMNLDQSTRDEVIELLAVVAACNTDVPQSEVEVVIRDEGGVILTSHHVEPRTDYRTR